MDYRNDSVEKGSIENGDVSPIENNTPPNRGMISPNSADDALRRLGLKAQLPRHITTLQMISTGWNICNSWLGVIVVLQYVLYNGGPLTLLYGIILMFGMYACIVGTIAELASIYPTAGGQYHWTAILSADSYGRVLSYICGAINYFSWIFINIGVILLIPQMIMAMAIFYNPNFVVQPYQEFLIFQLWNFIMVAVTCFLLRRTMWMFPAAFALSILTYFIVMVTCAASAPSYQPTDFVWSIFDNETGWADGIAFLSAMVAPNYMYTGIDGALHLAEEALNVMSVPRALVCTWLTGFVTAFTLCLALVYTGQDYTAILGTPTLFPVYELMSEAARSPAAATVFMVLFLIIVLYTELGSMLTASRLTWALARDGAIPSFMSRISAGDAPVYATVANGVVIFIIAFIYLGSPIVFASLVGTGIILNILSFAFPAFLLVARGRSERYLPSDRSFKLPGVVGWVANFFTVIWPLVGAIFYAWPALAPVDSSNMNWASAVIGIAGLFAIVNWFAWAARHYSPPKLER